MRPSCRAAWPRVRYRAPQYAGLAKRRFPPRPMQPAGLRALRVSEISPSRPFRKSSIVAGLSPALRPVVSKVLASSLSLPRSGLGRLSELTGVLWRASVITAITNCCMILASILQLRSLTRTCRILLTFEFTPVFTNLALSQPKLFRGRGNSLLHEFA